MYHIKRKDSWKLLERKGRLSTSVEEKQQCGEKAAGS